MTYSEKLKHPKWQKKRLEVLQRDNFSCVCCGNENKSLQVNHDIYIGFNPWDTPIENLRTVCETCHTILEYFKKRIFTSKTTRNTRFVIKYADNNFCVVNVDFLDDSGAIESKHTACLSLLGKIVKLLLLTDRNHWIRIALGIKVEDNG